MVISSVHIHLHSSGIFDRALCDMGQFARPEEQHTFVI